MPFAEPNADPAPEFRSPRETVRLLRALVVRHNGRVAAFTLLTLSAAVALWYLLYAIAYWLGLLFVSAAQGLEGRLPEAFTNIFWFAAAGLLLVAWLDQLRHPDDRPRDHKSAGEIVAEILLAVPRVTLAVWGTLSAWLSLDHTELVLAAALVDRLGQERRLRLQSLPVDIPNDAQRAKIVLALQLVQIIDVRREDREYWVALSPLLPRSLRLASSESGTQRRG